MNLRHVGRRRGEPAADGPHGFVGDDDIGGGHPLWGRSMQLPTYDVERASALALFARLADADDGDKPGAARGLRLGAHLNIRLAVVGAALRMSDDDVGRAK